MTYHLFVCHRLSRGEAASALDELPGRSVLEQLSEKRGGGCHALLIDMGPGRLEELLPRLLGPSG